MTSANFIKKEINLKQVSRNTLYSAAFIENNERQIEQYFDFLAGDKKLLLVNGFSGTGKSRLTNFIAENLPDELYILKYTCFETTILDDMLLSFFNTFRKFTIQGKFSPPRMKVENFTQKINSYFNSISQPILIILDSYDMILKENKQDILNFLNHIKNLENVKIIISSRNFNYEEFENIDNDKITLLAFSKNVFEKYLRENDIKNISILSNELYKQTKGYYGYVNMTLKIMQFRNYNMGKFLEAYSKSAMNFAEFLYKEMVSLIDPVSLHLFRLLAVMRIPLHTKLLQSVHLYNEDRIQFYIDNLLLCKNDENIYIPDFYREIIEKQIPENVMIKLHKACADLYNTQLPLKPLERDLKLSRQTMRNEIEYHSLFIPLKPDPSKIIQITQNQILPYTNIKTEENNKIEEVTKEIAPKKEEKIEDINFIFEDESVLENIADSINDFVTEKTEKIEYIEKNSNLSLTQLLNLAKQEEAKYNYKHAIMLYQNALTKNNDDDFDKFLPTIYLKLAQSYGKTSQWYEALENYTKAQDYYTNVSDYIKVAEVKLKIAEIYFIIYKQENAKYILNDLNKEKDLPNELKIKINMALGKISDNINEQYSYYNKSMSLIDSKIDKSIASEIYYSFASINDQKDNIKDAVTYYKKCILTEQNPQKNKYLSRALANLAELYDEAGKSEQAVKYYIQSLKIDEKSKNYNGIYATSRHLADLYSGKSTQEALHYLEIANLSAQKLKEPYYLSDINYELGNYHLLRKNFEQALKYFDISLEIATNSLSKEDIDKIKAKIDYIKNI